MKEIWIDEASLKELYESGSVFAKLRTEIQSIPEVQLVEADLDMAAELRRLHAINAELVEALEKAYLAGFNDSGEGYNGEYPFQDHGASPEKDSSWLERRDIAIQKIKEKQ